MMSPSTKDLIIIGGGPAGITAAVYAARQKMDFSVLTKDIGGQTILSGEIANYTGFQFITGPDLAGKFREHLEQYKFDLREGLEAVSVTKADQHFQVKTSDGQVRQAKTIIIASGKVPRRLNVPGEENFKGRGITYCATCDGPLFDGKAVAVIGGGNSGLDAALQMMKISPQVYLINLSEKLTGDAVMAEKVTAAKNVEVFNDTKTLEFYGDKFLAGLKVATKGQTRALAVKGAFVEVGLVPHADFIDFVEKNQQQEIKINCGAETSVPGIFAAGDVTSIPAKQIVIAAGEGAKAAMAAFRYLATH